MNRSLPGVHCSPSHEYPPTALCTDQPCQEWLEHMARPEQCASDHAHTAHYRIEAQDITECPGREFCDPKYQEPQVPSVT